MYGIMHPEELKTPFSSDRYGKVKHDTLMHFNIQYAVVCEGHWSVQCIDYITLGPNT